MYYFLSPCSLDLTSALAIQSHICVLQTALDLLSAGYSVHVVADGVSSCNKEEVPIAIARIRQAGGQITTSETIAFQLFRQCFPWHSSDTLLNIVSTQGTLLIRISKSSLPSLRMRRRERSNHYGLFNPEVCCRRESQEDEFQETSSVDLMRTKLELYLDRQYFNSCSEECL
jgi:hypothetical protein